MDKDKFDEYVKKFAEKRGITEEEALKHKVVQIYKEYLKEENKNAVREV